MKLRQAMQPNQDHRTVKKTKEIQNNELCL